MLLSHVALVTFVVAATLVAAEVYVTPQTRGDADKIIDFALTEKTFVFDRLAYVCDTFGPRFSGTPALEAAIDSVVATATADGLKVTTEPVMIPKWVRGREYARLVEPRNKTLHFLGLGMSTGTGGKAITAPVLVVKSFDDLAAHAAQAKGKIIVYNVPFTNYGDTVAYRSQGAVQAAKYGGVAALVRSVGPYGIQTVHTGSSQGVAGVPSGCISAEDASQLQRFQDRGQKPVIELSMEAHMEPDVPSRNIIIELTGTDKADEFVLIGGHMDSWDVAEGAMDDGGGVFVSWEAVRIIQQLGLKPRRTIRAIAFVNEENGDRGGIAYAAAHRSEMNRTSMAIETDGGTFAPFRLGFEGSPAALPALNAIGSMLARIGAGNVTMGGGGVDISPTCATGVPCGGLQVLDPRSQIDGYTPTNNPCQGFSNVAPTYDGEIPEGYFWFHHTEGDTVDRMDATQLQLSSASMAVWAYGVAQLDSLLPR